MLKVDMHQRESPGVKLQSEQWKFHWKVLSPDGKKKPNSAESESKLQKRIRFVRKTKEVSLICFLLIGSRLKLGYYLTKLAALKWTLSQYLPLTVHVEVTPYENIWFILLSFSCNKGFCKYCRNSTHFRIYVWISTSIGAFIKEHITKFQCAHRKWDVSENLLLMEINFWLAKMDFDAMATRLQNW